MRFLLAIVLTAAAAGAAVEASAQPFKHRQEGGRQMSQEERERMREDMRDAYRKRQDRPDQQQQKARQMSPEERGKLRRDIEDANKNLRR